MLPSREWSLGARFDRNPDPKCGHRRSNNVVPPPRNKNVWNGLNPESPSRRADRNA